MYTVETIKQTIAKDLDKAFGQLKHFVADKPNLKNSYFVLLGRFNAVKENQMHGLVTFAEFNLERNQIIHGLMNLLDQAETQYSMQGIFQGTPSAELTSAYFKQFPWKERPTFFLESFDATEYNSEVFPVYKDEKWKANVSSGQYILSNGSDPGAVKYHYFSLDQKNMSDFPISVELKIDVPNLHLKYGAGLLFGFEANSRQYLSFFINNKNEYQLWRKSNNGYFTVISGRSDLIKPFAYNKLGVIREKENIYLFINYEFVRLVNYPELMQGDCGIIAIGQGDFYFDNMAVYEK